jgi:hypothetical protein
MSESKGVLKIHPDFRRMNESLIGLFAKVALTEKHGCAIFPENAERRALGAALADNQIIRCATGTPRPRSQRSEVRNQQENSTAYAN